MRNNYFMCVCLKSDIQLQQINPVPVRALQAHERSTTSFRTGDSRSTLFLVNTKRFLAVPFPGGCRHTFRIQRWILTLLKLMHSVRGTAWSGVLQQIFLINVADLLNESVLQQFYHRKVQDKSTFESTVLSAADTLNLHVIWRWSLLKYNLQGKCLT